MVQDVIRQGISPATGSDQGSQAVTDFNLRADGALNIPNGETNTLNGAKDRDGYIRLTRNSDGNLILNSYADGKWTEYIAILDGLKSIGGITLNGNNVTVLSPVLWRINSIDYQKVTNTVLSVNPATDGNKRIDYIYADTNGNILLIEGTEVPDGNPYIPPTLPNNTILVAPVYISGSIVQQPIPDLNGYLTKAMADGLYAPIRESLNYVQINPTVTQEGMMRLRGNIETEGDINALEGVTSLGETHTKQLEVLTLGGGNVDTGLKIKNGNFGFGKATLTFESGTQTSSIYLGGQNYNDETPNTLYFTFNGEKYFLVDDDSITNSKKLTGSELFPITDPKDYVQEGYINQLQDAYLTDYNGKKIAFSGDSRFAEDGASPQYVTNYLKSNIVIGAFSGSCVTPGYGLPISSLEMVDPITATNPDVIVIEGGLNDFLSDVPFGNIGDIWNPAIPTFCGAYGEMIKQFVEKNPSKKIVAMTPYYANPVGSDPLVTYNKLERGANAIIRINNLNGVPTWDAFRLSGIGIENYETKLRDRIHPTPETYQKIGIDLARFIQFSLGTSTYTLDGILKNGYTSNSDIQVSHATLSSSSYPSLSLVSPSKIWDLYNHTENNSLRISERAIGDHVIIVPGGNIGIGGIESPTEKLDVNGSVRSRNLSGTGTRPVAAALDGTLVIDTGGARLNGGNTFTGVQVFSNGSAQPVAGYQDSGFLNQLSTNTLSTNVSTFLPADGGQLTSLIPSGSFTHASPPTSTSTGKRGSIWVDPDDKTLYVWYMDNMVARYFADPSF